MMLSPNRSEKFLVSSPTLIVSPSAGVKISLVIDVTALQALARSSIASRVPSTMTWARKGFHERSVSPQLGCLDLIGENKRTSFRGLI